MPHGGGVLCPEGGGVTMPQGGRGHCAPWGGGVTVPRGGEGHCAPWGVGSLCPVGGRGEETTVTPGRSSPGRGAPCFKHGSNAGGLSGDAGGEGQWGGHPGGWAGRLEAGRGGSTARQSRAAAGPGQCLQVSWSRCWAHRAGVKDKQNVSPVVARGYLGDQGTGTRIASWP